MIATVTPQPQRMLQVQDEHFPLFANAAGAPLPLIPRRTSSRSMISPLRSPVSSAARRGSSTECATPTPPVVRTPVSNDDSDTDTSSPSSDGTRPTISVRSRRIRGVRPRTLSPPELSTPIPFVSRGKTGLCDALQPQIKCSSPTSADSTPRPALARPLMYTPGMSLRIGSAAANTRSMTQAHTHGFAAESSAQGAKSAPCDLQSDARLIRKKSGQLVKSSLKSSKSATRGSLSVITIGKTSKSEPSTPTGKAVHFDAKLEHVKLFLAEQKPLAVSRDGSPTEDTSGTDSDFPPFIFGDGDERWSKRKLVMQLPNMPAKADVNAEVALEELSLSPDGTSVMGHVRVKNIAYAKWVVVRFTFDFWQTTSEVTGRYLESISDDFDRFVFSIKLNDLLARIEGKTLLMAVKYSVERREIWDNNSRQDYRANFTRVNAIERSVSDDESRDMLRSKLEKVIQSKELAGSAVSAQQTLGPDSEPVVVDFKTVASLAPRYDFGASLKSPWKPVDSPPRHCRTRSSPQINASHSIPGSVPWPSKFGSDKAAHNVSSTTKNIPTLGSPRDRDDCFRPAHWSASDVDDPPFQISNTSQGTRRHHRGYFDLNAMGASNLKRTPPGTPLEEGFPAFSSSKFPSFPPIEGLPQPSPTYRSHLNAETVHPAADSGGDSEMSTPCIATPTSSLPNTPSPVEPFKALPLLEDEANLSPETHYRQFLNKFCFFTGPGATIDLSALPRTQSTSDIEELLSGTSPRLLSYAQFVPHSPPRSSSADNLSPKRGGALTPAVSKFRISESPSITI